MTDTPTKQEIQSENKNVPGAMPIANKKRIIVMIEKEIEEVIQKI